MLTLAIEVVFCEGEYPAVVVATERKQDRDTRAGQMQLAGKERSLAGGDDAGGACTVCFSVRLYQ